MTKRKLALTVGLTAAGVVWCLCVYEGGRVWKETAALNALGPADGPVVPQVVALLDDYDSLVRVAATKALARIGTPAQPAVPALLRSLKDRSAAVRACAAGALGWVGPGAEAVPP